MSTKPNKTNLAQYNQILKELQILNPSSDLATFKDIFSGNAGNFESLPRDAKLYMRVRGKVAHHSPSLVKRAIKKAARVAKRSAPKKSSNVHTFKQLEVTDLQARLKSKQKNTLVSVVVPVYNNLDYTKKCLNSLAYQDSKYGFEVIVADDLSTDSTQQELQNLSGIRYIRNQSNLGFLLSCNAAVTQVKTKYTVLLNNDTEVLAGWLDNLIDPLEQDQSIGLVGSKLIYPDGTLQEAGGIIFADGNAWNYGKNASPNDSEYNYLREVDYVSGASISFQTKVFKDLGSFDKTFAPAYYEDTDLAMQMRQRGLKVVYNPFSSIIHYEGKSMGTDDNTGLKAYQKINKEKFYEKWRQVLQKDHFSSPEDILRARERNVTKNILVCDIHVPFIDKDAGSVRMHAILTCLRELGYHVTFWPDTHCPIDKYTKDLQEQGVEVMYGSQSFEEFISQRATYYDTVLLSRPIVAPRYLPLIRYYSPQAKIIFDTVDLHYIRLSRQAEIENTPGLVDTAEKWKVIEFTLMQQSDSTLVVSEFEKSELKKELPEVDVRIVSLIHELKTDAGKNFSSRNGVMFIGSYYHLPNKDGLIWFVEQVWPLVLKKLPKLKLTIIGSNMPKDLFGKKRSSIDIKGFVEDPSEFFETSRVFIAPLRFGAGIKGKILQAIEYGVPVVTTVVGAEGMFLEDGKTAMVAKTEEEFADKILELYSNKTLWQRISKASQKVLIDHFSREVAKKELAKLV